MYRCLILLFIVVSLISCSNQVWYKGNTHAHTVLCGHADTTPELVAKWYLDRGYNFLILSEHNIFIDPETIKLPKGRRKDFILVPGQEVTGHKHIHTTAMNIKSRVPARYYNDEKHKIVQNHVDSVINKGGHSILNHPNFHYALNHHHLGKVKKLYMFELFNGHPSVNNFGNDKNDSTEQMWDKLLSQGMLIYGVSSDDAHHFKKWGSKLSNPGRGWVMVNSNGKLDADSLTNAMLHGDFYASSGVFLSECKKSRSSYSVIVDHEASVKEISKAHVTGKKTKQQDGCKIEFIGDNGKILQSHEGLQSSYKINDKISYVRVKVTLTHKSNQYFAWGQPIFLDDRNHHH